MTMMAVVINNGVEVDDECGCTEEEESVVKNDKDEDQKKILTMFSATTILAEMLAKRQAQRRGT